MYKLDVATIFEKITNQAKAIHKFIKRFLKYLRINDDKDMLSLTNLAMILILYKIANTTATSMEDIGLLLGVLSSYQAKRWLEANGKKASDEDSEAS